MKNTQNVPSPVSTLNPQFIVDRSGKKTAVVLDIKDYETLLEEVEDLYLAMLATKALDEETELISHENVKKTGENKSLQ